MTTGIAAGYGHGNGENLYAAAVNIGSIQRTANHTAPAVYAIRYPGEVEKGDSGSPLFQERDGKPPLLLGLCTHRAFNSAYCLSVSRFIDNFIHTYTGLLGLADLENRLTMNITNMTDPALYTETLPLLEQSEIDSLCFAPDCMDELECQGESLLIGLVTTGTVIVFGVIVSVIAFPACIYLIYRTVGGHH